VVEADAEAVTVAASIGSLVITIGAARTTRGASSGGGGADTTRAGGGGENLAIANSRTEGSRKSAATTTSKPAAITIGILEARLFGARFRMRCSIVGDSSTSAVGMSANVEARGRTTTPGALGLPSATRRR
jgi:hypothetical protein